MNITKNHIYIGRTDKVLQWADNNVEPDDANILSEKGKNSVLSKIQEIIKNYLQLDNVNFLFGTGASIHLGAASIQSIPREAEKYIFEHGTDDVKSDFEKYIKNLQKCFIDKYKPSKGKCFQDDRNWKLIYDGTYIRNYIECKTKIDEDDNERNDGEENYGDILLSFEHFLNYLIAFSFKLEAEQNEIGRERLGNLIGILKEALFNICDVHGRSTSERDLKRIEAKGYKEAFERNKYIFHEKFLKSLMQRPLNLQRANIFTSNYDLAFEYAFDNLGIKYIDGFSGFHHRYFKPETFNYDVFYPGSTTAGKVQRIEKVVRYFKLHGSISWVSDNQRTENNIYGIEELPIDLIKRKAEKEEFSYGDLMIYPTAVKKSYTLDLPYSELFRHFAYCISQPQSVLFTVGYSFCDEHFNDIIYQALSSPSFTLIIIDYNGCNGSAEIKRLRDINDPRIIILEGEFIGDFLTLADALMPDFLDKSSSDKVADTLNSLINKKNYYG